MNALGASYAGGTPCNKVSAKRFFVSYLKKGLISIKLLSDKFVPQMSSFYCTSSFDKY